MVFLKQKVVLVGLASPRTPGPDGPRVLVQTFKVIDNFQELNPLRREYTRTHHLSGGHESQKRLSLLLVSTHASQR